MAKPEWGTKQSCPKCGTRFYDLGNAEPVTCIECNNQWVPEPILKSKQPLPFEAEKVPTAVAAEGEDGDLLVTEELDIDEAEDSVADVSLDDDDADLSEVVDPGMGED